VLLLPLAATRITVLRRFAGSVAWRSALCLLRRASVPRKAMVDIRTWLFVRWRLSRAVYIRWLRVFVYLTAPGRILRLGLAPNAIRHHGRFNDANRGRQHWTLLLVPLLVSRIPVSGVLRHNGAAHVKSYGAGAWRFQRALRIVLAVWFGYGFLCAGMRRRRARRFSHQDAFARTRCRRSTLPFGSKTPKDDYRLRFARLPPVPSTRPSSVAAMRCGLSRLFLPLAVLQRLSAAFCAPCLYPPPHCSTVAAVLQRYPLSSSYTLRCSLAVAPCRALDGSRFAFAPRHTLLPRCCCRAVSRFFAHTLCAPALAPDCCRAAARRWRGSCGAAVAAVPVLHVAIGILAQPARTVPRMVYGVAYAVRVWFRAGALRLAVIWILARAVSSPAYAPHGALHACASRCKRAAALLFLLHQRGVHASNAASRFLARMGSAGL